MAHLAYLYMIALGISLAFCSPLHAQDSLKTNIVKIKIDDELGGSQGTGIVIGQKGHQTYILTAWHIIEEAMGIEVSFFQDRRPFPSKATGKYYSDLDMTVIVAEDIPLEFLQLPISDEFVPGQPVLTVGHPFGNQWRINYPANALTNPIYNNDIRMLSINEEGIRPGSSGGAIYSNDYGLLAMITEVGPLDAIGIKLSYIKPILESWDIPTNYLDDSGVLPGLTKKLFEEKETYNILLLPFQYSQRCGPTFCEKEVADRLVRVSDEQDLNICVRILRGYNAPGRTLSYNEGRILGETYQANMVIWGDYETRCTWDSTMINIRYVSLDTIPEPDFVGTDGETGFQSIKTLTELSEGKMTGDVESLVYWSLGMRAYFNEKYAEAIELLEAIEYQEEREFGNLFIYIGFLYGEIDNKIKELNNYTKAIELDPKKSLAYSNRGTVFHDFEQYEAALRDYTNAIKLSPEYVGAYNNRGITYANLHQYESALKDYTKAIELNSESATPYLNRGNTYNDLKQYNAALKDYTKAIELNSELDIAYSRRGITYSYLRRFEAAEKDYRKAYMLKRKNGDVLGRFDFMEIRGISLVSLSESLSELRESLEDYNKAIELNPENADAYNIRGYIYSDLFEDEAALKDFHKAIELNPKYVDAYLNRANIYSKLEQYNAALKDYNKVIKLNPEYVDVYLHRGETYYDLGRYEAALKDFQTYMDFNPNYPRTSYYLANVYRRLNHFEQAKKNIMEYLKSNKNDNFAYGTLALIYAEEGKEEKFFQFLKIAIQNPLPYPLKQELEKEPVLERYQDNPRFQALIQASEK